MSCGEEKARNIDKRESKYLYKIDMLWVGFTLDNVFFFLI